MKPAPPRRLATMATLTAAERAADHAKAVEVARTPAKAAKKPAGVVQAVQTLFAKPSLAKQTEQVFDRRVAGRPLAVPGDRIPPDQKD